MKKMLNIYSFLLIIAAMLVTACKKNIQDNTAVVSNFSNSARVQVFNAAITAARNFVYVDGNQINGVSINYAGIFPAGLNTSFSIPAGFRSFLIRDTQVVAIPVTTQIPLSFAEDFNGGKYYTIFLYDTIPSAKQKTVQTNIEIPGDATARVRFANFIFSRTAVPAVDIFSIKTGTNVFTNIQVTDVTNYISYASAVNDTLYVRETGTANLLAQLNGFNPTAKRSYTLIFRGRYQTTTGTIARTLSSFINY